MQVILGASKRADILNNSLLLRFEFIEAFVRVALKIWKAKSQEKRQQDIAKCKSQLFGPFTIDDFIDIPSDSVQQVNGNNNVIDIVF